MINESLGNKLNQLKESTQALEEMWNKMGELSKKTSSDLSFDELKCQAADLSCEIFQQSVKQTNLISQAINTPDIEQGLADTLSNIKSNSNTIFTETKELATKSDVDEGVIYGLGEWQAIAEESGNFNARIEYVRSLWKNVEIEFTSEKVSSAPAGFDGTDFLKSALDKVVTAAKQYCAITDTMFALVDNDPRELVLTTVKNGLANAVTESFPSLNSITAHLSEALSIDGIADDIANTIGEYSDFSKASIDCIKDFATEKLSETITTNVLDTFDLQNKAAFDGGSLQGVANSLFGIAESFQIGDDFHSLEDAVDNLKQSASGVLGSAEDLISLATSSINGVSIEDLKGSLSDTFSESFSPLNSVTCFATQLCEFNDVADDLKGSFEHIAATTKDAVSTVKSAVTEIEFPQEALDTFDSMQEVSAGSGKLFAYGESILELADTAYEAAGDNESLLSEIDQIVQGAQDLLDSANSLLEMTQQDPREFVLDELKNKVSIESESLVGPMTNIADSTSNAIATGLLDESLTQTFDKIKENIAKAESSQAELKSTAQPTSKADSAPSEKATDKVMTAETTSDDSSSSETASAADKNSYESGTATESTATSSPESGTKAENVATSKGAQSNSGSSAITEDTTSDTTYQGDSECDTDSEKSLAGVAEQGGSKKESFTDAKALSDNSNETSSDSKSFFKGDNNLESENISANNAEIDANSFADADSVDDSGRDDAGKRKITDII